jgi:mono/diheme cytochrome c family protein
LRHLLLLGAALLLGACQQQRLVSQSALASQTRGHGFASASCAACHGIERDSMLSPNPRAPSFPAIVNRQGLTAETLSSWLHNAHNYPAEMEFELDPKRADDLVEYMLTLRDPNYRPID